MRRRNASILFALPLANALSLANFQQITSVLIPLSCQLTYDATIPSCAVSDFKTECSLACQASLKNVAKEVTTSCEDVDANASTLLGIVMNGGIVGALCPAVEKSTSLIRSSTTPVLVSTSQANSVTLPTESPGVTGGGGKTSSAQQATTTNSSKKTTTTKSTEITSTPETTSTSESADSSPAAQSSTGAPNTATSNKGSVATSSSAKTSASPKAAPKSDTGGGSPFDISSSASRIDGDSVLYTLLAVAWAGFIFGR